MKPSRRILSLIMVCVLCVGAFTVPAAGISPSEKVIATSSEIHSSLPDAALPDIEPSAEEDECIQKPFDVSNKDIFNASNFPYEMDNVLVKFKDGFDGALNEALASAGVESLEFQFEASDGAWYVAWLANGAAPVEAVPALRKLSEVQIAEYNFIYELESIDSAVDGGYHISSNEKYSNQWALDTCGIQDTWKWLDHQKLNPGGDSSIVVAVIDTGVDYTHEDLAGNIWHNPGEIPDNGVDDDGNGYIDDYYGADVISGHGNGNDDHGHGTHIAGIIAAENNKKGIVGIAFNTKIMPIKAGMSSGYFNQTAIQKAVMYAYENGADVINMSFGGSATSVMVQDALETAYTRCVLVASAGNEGYPNEDYMGRVMPVLPNYPAAYKFVLGVMSVGKGGVESPFSNFDGRAYTSAEYELYAPGEAIVSTVPGDKYATWNGTSMAAPMVSGMAALLRSYYSDIELYPTKYIYAQLASTSKTNAICCDPNNHKQHNIPKIADLYKAFTTVPSPEVGVSDYWFFDTENLAGSTVNNGDGVLDAGETVALGFELSNRWGMSKDTMVTIESRSVNGVPGKYIKVSADGSDWSNSATLNYGSVGTYSTKTPVKRWSGEGNDVWSGWENPFYVRVSDDCPNDYIADIFITINCNNGLSDADKTVYKSESSILLKIRRGSIIPQVIKQDMTLTKDDFYVISNSTTIEKGVTVTIEPGTQIQFWSDDPNDAYADQYIAGLFVKGTLKCLGTEEEPIKMFPSDLMSQYEVRIEKQNQGEIYLEHTNIVNPRVNFTTAEYCEFSQNYKKNISYRYLSQGKIQNSETYPEIYGNKAEYCAIYKVGGDYSWNKLRYCVESSAGCIFVDSSIEFLGQIYENCLFYGNNNYWDQEISDWTGGISSIGTPSSHSFRHSAINKIVRNSETGTVYIQFLTDQFPASLAERLAEYMGGNLVCINNADERDFLRSNNLYGYTGLIYDSITKEPRWVDSSEYNPTLVEFDNELESGTAVGDIYPFLNQSFIYQRNSDYIWDFYYEETVNGNRNGYYLYPYLFEIPGDVFIEEIDLEDGYVRIDLEGSYKLTPRVYPYTALLGNGSGGENPVYLRYFSADDEIATVDQNGIVTPKGIGKTYIYVFSWDMQTYAKLELEVQERVEAEGITFAVGEKYLPINANLQEKALVTPLDTTMVVEYSSSNEAVASVDAAGRVTGQKGGDAVITAKVGELTASYTVHVISPVTGIVFAEDVVYVPLDKEGYVSLDYTVCPADATDKTLIWESTDPTICYVGEDGALVTGDPGTVTIRATSVSSGVYADVVVSVVEAIDEARITDVIRIRNSFMAIQENGKCWIWGGEDSTPVPKPVSFKYQDRVIVPEDVFFYDRNGYYLYMTDDRGYLYYADLNAQQIASEYTLTRTVHSGIVKLCGGSNGSMFALQEGGIVWASGCNYEGQLGIGSRNEVERFSEFSSGYGVNVNISDILDVIPINGNTYFYTGKGEVYATGYCNGAYYTTPVLKFSGVDSVRGTIAVKGEMYEDLVDWGESWQRLPASDAFGRYNYGSGQSVLFYTNDGKFFAYGYNCCGMFGFGDRAINEWWVNEPVQLDNIVDAITVRDAYNVFYLTSEGALYAAGSSSNNSLATWSGQGEAHTPVPIRFNLNYPDTIQIRTTGEPDSLSTGNLQNCIMNDRSVSSSVLNEKTIRISFNTVLFSGKNLSNVTVKEDGKPLGCTKTIDLNNLLIERSAGFEDGKTYTLTVPADAVRTGSGTPNAELNITFTYKELKDAVPSHDPEVHEEQEEIVDDHQTQEEPAHVHILSTEYDVSSSKLVTACSACDYISEIEVSEAATRNIFTAEEFQSALAEFILKGYNTNFWHNAILNRTIDDDVDGWMRFLAPDGNNDTIFAVGGNYWGTISEKLVELQIIDYNDFPSLADINPGEYLKEAPEETFPFVVDAYLIAGNKRTGTVSNEEVTFVVEFNRDMDPEVPLKVCFGSYYPYADYEIAGDFTDARTWQGTTVLKTVIENGYQYWSIDGGRSAADANGVHLKHYKDWGRFEFTIDATSAMAMTMQGYATENGIELSWEQDDYDTLAGYNVYRSTEAEGMLSRINRTIILPETDPLVAGKTTGSFTDTGVEPGQKYYYTFTVVPTDLGAEESMPASRIAVTALDTMAPNIYHSAVYNATAGNNVRVSATVTDNVAVSNVSLYYRTPGASEWTKLSLSKTNDKYFAYIPSAAVTTAGVEYYIEAFDGISLAYAGERKADNPYRINVQASVDSRSKGDVDMDGEVTVRDALFILEASVGNRVLTPEQFLRADLNSDGKLSASEALRVMMYVNGSAGSLIF